MAIPQQPRASSGTPAEGSADLETSEVRGVDIAELQREHIDLKQRIAVLEAGRGAELGSTVRDEEVLDTPGSTGVRIPTSADYAMVRVNLPTYCVIALTQAHEALVSRDVARHAGDEAAAMLFEEQIAGLVCVAAARVADEFTMPPDLSLSDANPDIFRQPTQFDQELKVLQLAGLPPSLAEAHLRAALDSITPNDGGVSMAGVARSIRAVEDAACETHTRLVAARKARDLQAQQRMRRRRLAKRLVFGLGGVSIVVINGLAAGLIAFPLAPASIALGSAAAGAVANLVED